MQRNRNQPDDPILIATLGTEAQVVTAVVDLLHRAGIHLRAARVLHTHAPGAPVAQAVARLRQAFAPSQNPGDCQLELIPLLDPTGRPLSDIDSPQAVQSAFRCLYQQVRRAKLEGHSLHLSIAGGRKTLSLFGMACAQMLCDDDDHLWYLHSSGDFLDSKRLHPRRDDQAHLVEVPFIRWSRVSPVLTQPAQLDDPFAAIEHIRASQLAERLEEGRAFVLGALTPGEQRVVELLVRQGLSDAQIAEQLVLSPRTVEGHLRSAYNKAANHWQLSEVKRSQLITLLNLYYSMLPDQGQTAKDRGFPA